MRYSTSTTGPPRSPRVGLRHPLHQPGLHQPAQHSSAWPHDEPAPGQRSRRGPVDRVEAAAPDRAARGRAPSPRSRWPGSRRPRSPGRGDARRCARRGLEPSARRAASTSRTRWGRDTGASFRVPGAWATRRCPTAVRPSPITVRHRVPPSWAPTGRRGELRDRPRVRHVRRECRRHVPTEWNARSRGAHSRAFLSSGVMVAGPGPSLPARTPCPRSAASRGCDAEAGDETIPTTREHSVVGSSGNASEAFPDAVTGRRAAEGHRPRPGGQTGPFGRTQRARRSRTTRSISWPVSVIVRSVIVVG